MGIAEDRGHEAWGRGEAAASAELLGEVSGLRDVHESLLDEDQLRSLLADVATYGTLLEVSVRTTARGRLESNSRLAEIYLKLVERAIFGVQLRYEFRGVTRLDTLIATQEGVRLVRFEIPE